MPPELPKILRVDPESGAAFEFEHANTTNLAHRELAVMEDEAINHAGGYTGFLSDLYRGAARDTETGVDSVWLTGHKGDEISDSEVFLLLGGFGVPVGDMMRIAEYLRRMGIALGVADNDGKPLGVLLLGASNKDVDESLSNSDLSAMRKGDLSPLATRLLTATKNRLRQKFDGTVRTRIISYSYGSALSPAFAVAAADDTKNGDGMDIVVDALIMGALPNPELGRPKLDFLRSFGAEALKGTYPPTTPGVFLHSLGGELSYWKDVLRARRMNSAIPNMMLNNNPIDNLAVAGEAFKDMVVNFGFSTADRVGRFSPTMTAIRALRKRCANRINGVFSIGPGHTWARNLPLLAVKAGSGMIGLPPLSHVDITQLHR